MNLNEYRKTFLKPVNRNLKFKETLDTLEQDNEFQKRAERFLTSVGENSDDIFEYLRDSDYNLYSGFKRASESKLFTPQQKADYRYLRQRFDRADTGSLKQYLGAAKDIGIDLVTDPTLLTAVITSPVTGGATLAARAALAKGASTGLKQLAKNQTNKAIAVTAAEAGGWTGLDNYFRQETEVNTGIRKLFSTPELVGSIALGTLMGGLLGAGAQKLAIVHSKKASEFADDEYLEQVGSMAAYRLGTRKDKIIARTIGKPTAILNTMAQFSPIADALRKLIRYDAGKEFFNRTNKPLEFSFGENINWRTGNYKLMYEQAISPLYTKQNGVMTDEQQKNIIRLLRGGPKEGATMAEIVVANNLKKFYDTIFNHAVKNKLISPKRRVENYFPISWNRKAIKENPEKFRELLLKEEAVSPDNVDEVIAGVLDEKNTAYGETANILTGMRGLNIKDENVFEDFLINDLHAVSHSYYAKAARNIETKKAFGLRDKNTGELKLTRDSALEEFEKQWVDPLNQELIAKGVKGGLTKTERNNIVNLFKTLTGDLNYYKSDLGQGIYDALKLSQQVAHLPLATLSSMSEVFIPLTKGKPERYTQELLKSIGEAGELFTKKIPRILKDKHNLDQPEVFNEMNKVFLAVEEALADRVENLAGEGMQTEWVKKGARGFFKANLLTQWTRLVQLASFNIGKDLIRSNLKALHKASKAGTDIYKATGKLRRYKEELFDLGIDIEQGIKWVDDGAKQADALKDYSELTDSEKFYQVNLIRGAGRFVNEVILNPAREQAIKPIIQSNPKVDILFQFLGYPTAFSNTVLKNYARQVILNPVANAPKILGATVLMTGTALGLNYVRGSDESREEYFKDPQKTIQKAIQRVGLLGPLEHGVRFSDSLEYSKNPALSLLTLGGPILDDTLGSVFYRRGLSETLAKNIPGYASKNVLENLTGLTPYDNITEGAKKLDKSLKESMFGKPVERSRYERDYQRSYRRNYQEGGLVSDMLFEDDMIDPYTTQIDKDNPVLNVADDPTKRVNPYTGTAYSEGTRPSVVATLQRRRRFAVGSLVAKGAAKLFSPTLKGLLEKAPINLKGKGAIEWVKSSKAGQKGIKPREIERLELIDFLEKNPDVSLQKAADLVAEKEVKVIGQPQLEQTGKVRHVAFDAPKDAPVSSLGLSKVLRSEKMKNDKNIIPLEESIAMMRETGHSQDPIQEITQEEASKLFPSGNNKKFKFRIRTIAEDTLFSDSFIYGNKEDGYSAFHEGYFYTLDFPKDLNEAKVRFQQLINRETARKFIQERDYPIRIVSNEEYERVGSEPIETYGKTKEFKYHIDLQLPGGENYEEFSINWEGAGPNEKWSKSIARSKGIPSFDHPHIVSDNENSLMHILGRDRKLAGRTGKNSNIDEMQSDLIKAGLKYGWMKPQKEILKIEKEVEEILNKAKSKGNFEELDLVSPSKYSDSRELGYGTYSINMMNKKLNTEGFFSLKDIIRVDTYTNLSFIRNRISRNLAPDDLDPEQVAFYKALGKKNLSKIRKLLEEAYEGVPNYPFKKDWELLGVKQWLLKAVNEGKDSISASPSEVLVDRWSPEFTEMYKKVYDIQIPKAMKKLAKKYGGKFEKGWLDGNYVFGKRYPFSEYTPDNVEELMEIIYGLDRKNIIARNQRLTFEDMIESSRDRLGEGRYSPRVRDPKNIKNQILFNIAENKLKVNILTITPEMREKILKDGLPAYGYRRGGEVRQRYATGLLAKGATKLLGNIVRKMGDEFGTVVDQPVYHGSVGNFKNFKKSKQKTTGVSFALDPKNAKQYGPNIRQADISKARLWDYRNPNDVALLKKEIMNQEFPKNLQGKFTQEKVLQGVERGHALYLERPFVSNAMKKLGYDGHIGLETLNFGKQSRGKELPEEFWQQVKVFDIKKIKQILPAYGYRRGGLVNRLQQRNMYG